MKNNTYLLYLSLILFAVSLVLPGITIKSFGSGAIITYVGYRILAVGWLGILLGMFGWYGNLFFFLALSRIRKQNLFKVFPIAMTALAFGLSDFVFFGIVKAFTHGDHPIIKHFDIGYYVWLASFASLALYARSKSQKNAVLK